MLTFHVFLGTKGMTCSRNTENTRISTTMHNRNERRSVKSAWMNKIPLFRYYAAEKKLGFDEEQLDSVDKHRKQRSPPLLDCMDNADGDPFARQRCIVRRLNYELLIAAAKNNRAFLPNA